MGVGLDLGRQVLDKGLLTRDGHRAGKVDDLILEVDAERPGDLLPEVCAIVTGPTALALEWPSWVRAMVRCLYRAMGVENPEPITIPWRSVTYIQAVIHLSVALAQTRLHVLEDAVDRRFIEHVPGA